jgi:bacteriocin-like protein
MTNDSKDTKPNTDVENNKTQLTEEELTEKELGQVTGGKLMQQQCCGGKHFDNAILTV